MIKQVGQKRYTYLDIIELHEIKETEMKEKITKEYQPSELKDLDTKSRKTMTMHGGLHPKSDIDRLYMKRKEGGRSLISVERRIREEENSLGFYVANSEESLIRRISAAETMRQLIRERLYRV